MPRPARSFRSAAVPLSLLVVAGCAAAAGDRAGEAPGTGGAAAPAGATIAAGATDDPVARADGPVVLELFTSQGCSSCPPADRLLSSLRRGDRIAGRPVIPLAFHVDYWNDLGWADPLSSAAWSRRQSWYAHRLGAGRVYTPQLVIAGAADVVGSRRGDAERAVAAAPATADLEATTRRDGRTLHVTATAPGGGDAWVAVVEDGLVTDVASGENADRTLRSDHVVRALVRVAGAGTRGDVDVTLEPRWRDVHVVVFAQDDASGAIVAARALD
ncbi:MAG: DUF1223 domain-containing protein [Kofleriaceae bacterium]|nr:DUF1223 domain-containing protein [Kofleriaceae bacterium]MCB9575220.1 DUF1223 domain-containing protein [Kofleriaceae bacterium]